MIELWEASVGNFRHGLLILLILMWGGIYIFMVLSNINPTDSKNLEKEKNSETYIYLWSQHLFRNKLENLVKIMLPIFSTMAYAPIIWVCYKYLYEIFDKILSILINFTSIILQQLVMFMSIEAELHE